MEQNNNNNGITISDIIRVLRKNLILIGIVTVLVFTLGVVYTFGIAKPTYKSTATVKVEVPLTTETTSDISNSVSAALRYVQSVSEAVKKPNIIDKVAEDNKNIIDSKTLLKETATSFSNNSVFVNITVTDKSGKNAQILSTALAKEIAKYSNTETDSEIPESGRFYCSIVVFSEGTEAAYASPNKTLYLIVSLLGGIVLALIIVFIKEFASNKFLTPEDVRVLDYPILNTLIDDKSKSNKDDESLIEPTTRNFEPYNRLISNVQFANVDNPYKVIMFTSSVMDELKTTVCANTAYTIAHNEKKVVIIDLDARKPRIHSTFGLEKANGVVEYLAGKINKNELIKHTEQNVDIITVGKNVINPVTLLESHKLKELIDELKEDYNYILIDTPPLTACNDASIISKLADGVVFNVAINQGKKKEIKSSLDQLKDAGANIIGINITKANIKDRGGYNYYYYYEYGDDKKTNNE